AIAEGEIGQTQSSTTVNLEQLATTATTDGDIKAPAIRTIECQRAARDDDRLRERVGGILGYDSVRAGTTAQHGNAEEEHMGGSCKGGSKAGPLCTSGIVAGGGAIGNHRDRGREQGACGCRALYGCWRDAIRGQRASRLRRARRLRRGRLYSWHERQ